MELNVLYISYDGATDPLGRSQILPYLKGLSRKEYTFFLLSFEKKRTGYKKRIKELHSELHKYNIQWKLLSYHKSPPVLSTLYDIIRGMVVCLSLIRKNKIKFIHVRSYVPALMAFWIKKISAIQYIFDMRGFWVDERVEGNLWKKNGFLYKTAKHLEKKLLINSSQAIVLTQNMKKELQKFDFLKKRDDFISVIPTCVDLNRFDYKKGEIDSPPKGTILVYSGSLGTVYMIDEMLCFFRYLKEVYPHMKFKILTHSSRDIITKSLSKFDLSNDDISIKKTEYYNMPFELYTSNVGIAFYKPTYSAVGRAPTKLGEYLACGLPIIVNAGVGDLDDFVREERVGVVVENLSEVAIRQAVDDLKKLLDNNELLKERCQNVGKKYFSLDDGVQKYHLIYKTMTN